VTEAAAYLRDLRDSTDLDSINRLAQALFEAQRKSIMKNITGWFYSVSGFNRPYGLMSGNTRGARRVARYTLSNELLSTLVYVALADHGREENGRKMPADRLPLKEFLCRLEKRYGLLIDKPPKHLRRRLRRRAGISKLSKSACARSACSKISRTISTRSTFNVQCKFLGR
jgi:hypothetical protein